MELAVSEIFKSIQGESTHAGRICTFIRLAGCNLRCDFCDTRYALKGGKKMSVEEVIRHVKRFHCNLVEITGGEPLLQKGTIYLIRRLLKDGFEVMLETNGSIDMSKVPRDVIKIMDIKTPSSKMH